MLTRIAASAIAAALVAGLAVSVIQEFTTTPLIIAAERYEGHRHADSAAATRLAASDHALVASDTDPRLLLVADSHGEGEADGHHGEGNEWAPQDGLERTFYSSVATIGTSFGFALVVLAVMILAGAQITTRSALMWGAAAFVATGLAPGLGLSPELPGSAAAELSARQFWWIGTAIATGAGLFLLLRVSTVPALTGGLALIAAPHVIGAPHPAEFTSAVPAELSGHFAASSLVVQAVLWALTAAVAGYVWERVGDRRRSVVAQT